MLAIFDRDPLIMNASLVLIILWAMNVQALPTNITNNTSSDAPNYGDPNMLCVPTRWTDIASFFIGNYFAHAATVKSYPGESTLRTIIAILSALLFPTSGLMRGLNGILRRAQFRNKSFWNALSGGSDFQTAAAAGALCMVVRRKSWQPYPRDQILDVVFRNKCSISYMPPHRAWKDSIMNTILIPTEHASFIRVEPEDGEQQDDPKKLKVYNPPWAQEQGLFWGYTDTSDEYVHFSRTINGSYDFKDQSQSYTLAHVPRDAEVEIAETSEEVRLGIRQKEEYAKEETAPATTQAVEEPTAATEPALPIVIVAEKSSPPNPAKSTSVTNSRYSPSPPVISASYSLPKALIAVVQLIYAITTLYQSRGNQITVFGYAAFGLTVIPYAIMSVVNLISNLVTPDYPTLFLVRSNVMDEAIRRGARFDGVVGRLVDNLDTKPTIPRPMATVDSDDVSVWYRDKDRSSAFPIAITDYYPHTTATIDTNMTSREFITRVLSKYRLADSDNGMTITESIAVDIHPSVFVPSCSEFRRARSSEYSLNVNETRITAEGSFRFGMNGHVKQNLYPLCRVGVLIFNALILFSIIGSLSHFDKGSSTYSQRVWIMVWYVFGLYMGVFPLEPIFTAFQTPSRSILGQIGASAVITVILAYGIPAIGGFVVVAQMLQAYDTCTTIS